MKKSIAVLLLSVLLIFSCRNTEIKGDIVIEDVGIPFSDSVVVQLNGRTTISNAIVRLVGDVDGAFILNNIKYGEGPIDSVIHKHDWYRPVYKIEYEPIEAKNGYLMVIVEFQ